MRALAPFYSSFVIVSLAIKKKKENKTTLKKQVVLISAVVYGFYVGKRDGERERESITIC